MWHTESGQTLGEVGRLESGKPARETANTKSTCRPTIRPGFEKTNIFPSSRTGGENNSHLNLELINVC